MYIDKEFVIIVKVLFGKISLIMYEIKPAGKTVLTEMFDEII